LIFKFINLLKVAAGYFLSRIFRQVYHWGSPVSLSVEPTNCCNLHCPECPSGMQQLTRKKGVIEFSTFKNLTDQVAPTLYYLNLYFQGEPFLHPRFTELVRYAKSKKIYVSTSTNGHFLTPENVKKTIESGLDKLIISLDGTDAAAYMQYRAGGDLNTVLEGIKEIVKQKKAGGSNKPKVVLQFLLLKSNQHQTGAIQRLGRELGVDKVELKTAQFNDFREGNPLMPDNLKHSRYRLTGETKDGQPVYRIKNRMPDHCFRMWSSCVVSWDGFVVPCCFDKDATYRMGNVTTESFRNIWKNDEYRDFRKKILSSRKSIDICNNCTEGSGVTSFLL
jgi:radical SAM protein with 4Fe4S-binding SPASM domain